MINNYARARIKCSCRKRWSGKSQRRLIGQWILGRVKLRLLRSWWKRKASFHSRIGAINLNSTSIYHAIVSFFLSSSSRCAKTLLWLISHVALKRLPPNGEKCNVKYRFSFSSSSCFFFQVIWKRRKHGWNHTSRSRTITPTTILDIFRKLDCRNVAWKTRKICFISWRCIQILDVYVD